jgi:ubiquitin-like 1-activating enzyme E1 A
VLQLYRTDKALDEIPSSADHVDAFVDFAQRQLETHGLPVDFFSPDELTALVAVAHVDLPPVSAIVAGILGQEVIKAVSQKDEPICNVFCFDGVAGSVRRIG